MKPVLTVQQMRDADAEHTNDVDAVMDIAGFGIATEVTRSGFGYGDTIRILCGPGNNGGDGYVAAAYLARRGAKVYCHAVAIPDKDSAAHRARERARRAGAVLVELGEPQAADLIIDAVVGTGSTRPLDGDVAAWTEVWAPVLSVDIPSGIDGDTGDPTGPCFVAFKTVTFHALKRCHVMGVGPRVCGDVEVIDLGFPSSWPEMAVMEIEDAIAPIRTRDVHKWSAGAVATIGGTSGFEGAAHFASLGALRSGAGVSIIVATAETRELYSTLAPEIPVMEVDSIDSMSAGKSVASNLDRFDSLIVGPGLEPADPGFVHGLLDTFPGYMIVDAGALTAIDDPAELRRDGLTVLTPHAGEFIRLTGEEMSYDAGRRLAEAADAVVLLKGNPTIVIGHDLDGVYTLGGPELATIGSGDVLAGMIGAMLATIGAPDEGVGSAVLFHALAGRLAAEDGPPSVREILESVPVAMRLQMQLDGQLG